MRRPPLARTAALTTTIVMCALPLAAACSDDDESDSSNPSGSSDDDSSQVAEAGVLAACDRLEELANATLEVRDVTSGDEVLDVIQEPWEAFVEAAGESGDAQLAELGEAYDDALSAWLAGSADPDTASNDANAALDQAGARCIGLGAPNDFPQEP